MVVLKEVDNDGICCSTGQLELIKENFAMPASIFKEQCPTCYYNFVKNFCDLTCSPQQDTFVKPTSYFEGPGIGAYENQTVNMVKAVLYYVNKQFNEETYDSCKNVQFPGISDTIMMLLCGPWGSKNCDSVKWWNYMGTVENGYSPFGVSYEYGKFGSSEDNYTYHNPPIATCNEPLSFPDGQAYAGCKCVDCEEACGASDTPQLEPTEEEFLIWGVDGMILIGAFSFAGIMALFYTCLIARRLISDCMGQINCITKGIEKMGDRLLEFVTDIFTAWGKMASKYPKTVISLSMLVALGLSVGIIKLEVTTDPIELWASPSSRSRVEKDFFDKEFRPFYRTTQVIIKSIENSEHGIEKFQHTDRNGKSVNFGPIFNTKFLLDILDLQKEIQNIKFVYDGTNMTLNDVCNQPLNDGCNIQNIWGYWQEDVEKLNRTVQFNDTLTLNYLDHFIDCSQNPSLTAESDYLSINCMASWGGPISAYYILGGFIPNGNTGFPEDPKYSESTAVVMSILLDNFDPKSLDEKDVTGLEKAMAWEEEFVKLMKDWEANRMPKEYMEVAFNSERSVEDEINRETYGDLATIAISYILMFIYITLSLGQYNNCSINGLMIESKVTLGLMGVMIVLVSVAASVGIFGMLGVPATLIIFEIIPFLVLAVGVDNIFIMVQHYQRSTQRDYETHSEHVGRIVGEVAPSMLLSSASESTCFFLGALTDMPAVRAFALYAGMALLIDFFMQITCFVSLISLDMERQQNSKFDIFCCVQGKKNDKRKQDGVLYKFFQYLYAPFIMKTWTRNIVMVVFLGLFCSSLAVVPKIEVGLDQEVSMPEDSFVLKYFIFLKDYLSVGPPVYFVVNNTNNALDFSNTSAQNKLCMGHPQCDNVTLGTLVSSWAKVSEESFIATAAFNWVDTYLNWIDPLNKECCRIWENSTNPVMPCPTEETSSSCIQCTNTGFKESIKWFLDANPRENCAHGGHAPFGDAVQLSEWLSRPTENSTDIEEYNQPKHDVVNSNMMAFHTILKTSKDYYTALKRARELTDIMTKTINENMTSENHVNVFPYSIFYVYYEQYLTMWDDTIRSMGISLGSIFLVTFVLMGFDFTSSLIIIITILFILVNLGAVMYWWDITLNAVSLVNLVMAVGISVEFCSHITRTFSLEQGEDKVKRAESALVKMGSSVLSGITLTKFAGIIVLGFAKSQIFTIFYFRFVYHHKFSLNKKIHLNVYNISGCIWQ